MKRCMLLFVSMLLPVFLLLSCHLHDDKSADLLEAYQIASAEAVKWDKSAQPYFISSVDDRLESKSVKGENGKRNAWNFDFVVENTNKHYIITLHDKTVVNKIEAESVTDSACIIHMEDLCISAVEAVTIAKENYGLLPGTDWAQGYHFVLENNGSALILSVVGRGADGTLLRVLFHAKTGRVVGTAGPL